MRQLFKIVKFDINTTTDLLVQNANLRKSVNVININIDFWRWVKVNQKQIASVDKFKAIPLLDKNNVLIMVHHFTFLTPISRSKLRRW